jgi:hypothetical protein
MTEYMLDASTLHAFPRLFVSLISHQPPVNNIFISKRTNQQQT